MVVEPANASKEAGRNWRRVAGRRRLAGAGQWRGTEALGETMHVVLCKLYTVGHVITFAKMLLSRHCNTVALAGCILSRNYTAVAFISRGALSIPGVGFSSPGGPACMQALVSTTFSG